jgi:hypothetical protein
LLSFAAERLLSRFALVRLLAQLQKLLTDLPVVFGLLHVSGPLAASENGSEQTALQDGRACDYDPRAEKAGPTLLTGTSNKGRETMRDIISAGRRDTSWCRVVPIDFIACLPPANARLPGKCPLGVLQSDAPCFPRIGR